MASILVLFIVLGIAGYQYQKGTFVRAFIMIIISICSTIAAFAYFEALAKVIISQSGNGRFFWLVAWAQPLSFILLFVLVFSILQTIAIQLTRKPIDLGLIAERVGRAVCGIISGFIVSGFLLTAGAMAPLPNKYPYERFEQTQANPEKPKRVLLGSDGFVTGWFSMVSKGSFSGKRSFKVIHPGFLDQLYLNRLIVSDEEISLVTSINALAIPKRNSVWMAQDDLRDAADSNGPLEAKRGHNLIIVRTGIKKKAMRKKRAFTLSQLRLICKKESGSEDTFAGEGINIYPVGYLKTATLLETKLLGEKIKIEQGNPADNVIWFDFAFYVPKGRRPVLMEFKQNSIATVPAVVSSEKALSMEGSKT